MIRFKVLPPMPLDWGNSELHLPCVILVDTSASMLAVKNELHKGLDALLQCIRRPGIRKTRHLSDWFW